MVDITEWIGMFVFAIIIGGFLGFVGSQGSIIAGIAGAVALIILSAIYLLTIANNGSPFEEAAG